jgi:hypothetical protein
VPSQDEVRKFLEKNGTFGKRLTQVLETIAPEVAFLHSTEGWNALKLDVDNWKSLLVKFLKEGLTDDEIIELRYISNKRIPRSISSLDTYYKGVDIVSSHK